MLIVANKSIKLSVIRLNVVMLSVVMLSVIMLSVVATFITPFQLHPLYCIIIKKNSCSIDSHCFMVCSQEDPGFCHRDRLHDWRWDLWPGVNLIKPFSLSQIPWTDMLECLSLGSMCSLLFRLSQTQTQIRHKGLNCIGICVT
jgi:hypothetical protein